MRINTNTDNEKGGGTNPNVTSWKEIEQEWVVMVNNDKCAHN